MLIGIDVGGTYTDGVLYDGGSILEMVKHPTVEDNLESSILSVLDELLRNRAVSDLERVVFSTTLVTNLIAGGKGDQVAMILIPGPGLNIKQLNFFPGAYLAGGAIDFHGRITEPLDQDQLIEIGRQITGAGFKRVAVIGKFSNRNNSHERRVGEILQEKYPHLEVVRGYEVSGELNFLRRAATTYYTAVTRDKWSFFAKEMQNALRRRGIEAPVNILKADGGTMPLEVSLQYPCETVFSGPAASVMGAFALTMDNRTSVVVDIGGTTSDLALILEGKPLYASSGAEIGGYYTNVHAFAVRSIALGGDSAVRLQKGRISIGPERLGPAACFGGPAATPTDAYNLLEGGKIGSPELSSQALEEIATRAGVPVQELAREIVDQVNDRLEASINDMFKRWEEEPAYKVWELVNKRPVKAERVIGIGAAAGAFIPSLAGRFDCEAVVHRCASVANALGAAVSRPTFSLQLHADTRQQRYQLNSGGLGGEFKADRLTEAKALALAGLQEIAAKRGLGQYADRYEYFLEEQFNMVSGWSTTGKLFDVGIQIAPGVIDEFEGVQ